MSDWSDDEDLWVAMEPALCAPNRLALAEGDVAAVVESLDLPPQSSVLDLACGPGAHAIAFAVRGYRVTGVDRSSRILQRARSDATARGVHVEWVEADMRRFRRKSAFHLVSSLYTSFGYFDDFGNREVLENILESLRPGGVLLLDLVGRETLTRRLRDPSRVEAEGVQYFERCRIMDDGSSLISEWVVTREGRSESFTVKQRLYSESELRDLLESSGFVKVALYGSLGLGTPYDERAERLVAVGYAPPTPL